MKKMIYLLIALPLFFTSCQNDEQAVSEETVQVSFTAELPQQMETRASSALSVDKVYCAVFENGEEIQNLRGEIGITEGQNIVFAPRLIKGRTYDIVFWASKDGSYNVTDMTAITRYASISEAYYDAFTATTEITVEGNHSEGITLKRPIAQLNMGVIPNDWNGVVDPNTFDMKPTTITLKIDGKSTFNALTGNATGTESEITYNLSVSGAEFTCKENTYRSIAMCYVLAESEKQNINITYSIYDENGNAIQEDRQIIHVPLQRNYATYVVGGLLTGTIGYSITLDEELLTDDEHSKEIE